MTNAPADQPLVIRDAVPDDVPEILAMIHELAEFERSAHLVESSEEKLHAALFPEQPAAFCLIAQRGRDVIGFAAWYVNFSTWTSQHGIYLEDLFVRPQFRGSGAGKRLLERLGRICLERGYPRLEWWVLDWNEDAIAFYRRLGAEAMDEWTVYRITGEALQQLGSGQ
jgi:GNAT superfamily N-acetyltransferase